MTHEADVERATGWSRKVFAALCGLALGLACGAVQPRGPVTPTEGLLLLAGGFAAGFAGRRLSRSGWAAVLVGVGHVAGFELARAGSPLATVGELRLDTPFGVIGFVLGRLVPWALAWLAIAVGSSWARPGGMARRVVGSLLLVVLAVGLVVPPSAPPVAAAPGGGVAELVEVELGGHRQWIEARGASDDLPILLYLSGGPGQSDLAFSRALLEPLTADFLVVGYDQRGNGKSYPDLDPTTLTLDRAVADVVDLARWLCDRYGQQKVYLLGESWGTLLGTLAVQRAPELFHGYVASGQMADPHETDAGIYDGLRQLATDTGDSELLDGLTRMGPPPYRSVFDYGEVMLRYPLLEGEYTPPAAYRERAASAGLGPFGVLGQEYGPLDKLNVLRGLLDTFTVMYPQLREVDLREQVTSLDVPVVVMAGEHELVARTAPAREWFDRLEAPSKLWLDYPDGGHSVAFEHADDLHRVLLGLEDAR